MAKLDLPIFLDLKLHDIPNTVAKAIQALRPLDPAIITIHASGGRAMMEDAKAAAPSGTKVVAVTVLTSLDGEDLKSVGLNRSEEHTSELQSLMRISSAVFCLKKQNSKPHTK